MKFCCEEINRKLNMFSIEYIFFIVLWGDTATPLTLHKPSTSSAKPHPQAGSPVVMEMQTPTVLG